MARPVKGDVVVLPFPFSNLATAKRRPALVLADAGDSDFVLCQITSRAAKDSYAVPLGKGDFATGGLKVDSVIRPNKLFTANGQIILYSAGRVKKEKSVEVESAVIKLLHS